MYLRSRRERFNRLLRKRFNGAKLLFTRQSLCLIATSCCLMWRSHGYAI